MKIDENKFYIDFWKFLKSVLFNFLTFRSINAIICYVILSVFIIQLIVDGMLKVSI